MTVGPPQPAWYPVRRKGLDAGAAALEQAARGCKFVSVAYEIIRVGI